MAIPKPFASQVPQSRRPAVPAPGTMPSPAQLAILKAIEQKVLWLSSWTIHHANKIRPSRDGLKVGGHQASSASLATLCSQSHVSCG